MDALRDEYESNSEWRLRRQFLEINAADNLPEDKLICLSKCFINVAVYGCQYPASVMRELSKRSGNILKNVKEEHKEKVKQKYKMSFVREGEKEKDSYLTPETASGIDPSATSTSHAESTGASSLALMCSNEFWERGGASFDNLPTTTSSTVVPERNRPSFKSKNFCEKEQPSSCSSIEEAKPVLSTEEYLQMWKNEKYPVLLKIRKLVYEILHVKSSLQRAKEKIYAASNRVPVTVDFATESVQNGKKPQSNVFYCSATVEGILVGKGQGSSIKGSKTNAAEVALGRMYMPYLRIVSQDSQNELQGSLQPFTEQISEKGTKKKKKKNDVMPVAGSTLVESNVGSSSLKRRLNEGKDGIRSFKPLEEFVIIESMDSSFNSSPLHILDCSANFNKMLMEYEYFFKGNCTQCVLRIENHVVADVRGENKIVAKKEAAAEALARLRELCWVIKTKHDINSDSRVSKDEMLREFSKCTDAIGSGNIGNKLLRKMGWSGGGVGKDGAGIAEPVSVNSSFNREGLGLGAEKGITQKFRTKVKDIVKNYAASGSQNELVFSCDFSPEERQVIHMECRKLNLKSKSQGKGDGRFLCVSRKRTSNELFDHLKAQGGETERYQLLPPGSTAGTDSSVSELAKVIS